MSVHDFSKDGKLAKALFDTGLMSDTKWRKLFLAIATEQPDIQQMRVKFIDVADIKVMQFPPSLAAPWAYMDTIEFGPVSLRSIEWVAFDVDLSGLIETLGLYPFDLKDGITTISAYS